jgi:hypothetical protein
MVLGTYVIASATPITAAALQAQQPKYKTNRIPGKETTYTYLHISIQKLTNLIHLYSWYSFARNYTINKTSFSSSKSSLLP